MGICAIRTDFTSTYSCKTLAYQAPNKKQKLSFSHTTTTTMTICAFTGGVLRTTTTNDETAAAVSIMR